jgi:hypothetical protein
VRTRPSRGGSPGSATPSSSARCSSPPSRRPTCCPSAPCSRSAARCTSTAP